MTRPMVNYLLDWSAFVLFAALLGTGLLMTISLPAGSGNASVLGWTRHDWGDAHFWIAMGFLLVLAVHLFLHFAWLKALTLGKSTGAARRTRAVAAIAGVAVLLLLAGLFVAIPVAPATDGGRHEVRNVQEQRRDTDPPRTGQGRRQARGASYAN